MAGDNDYSIVVVANGSNVSPNVLAWLATRSDVRVIRLTSGSHPLARRVGAETADSEFLAFLDDDDELIADTLGARIAEFRRHPEVDVLITDGLRINGSSVTRIFPPPPARHPDLIRTMMQAGWGAGALTLRLRNIDLAAFDPSFRHLEWTLTVLDLASRYRFAYLDLPTYRYYENTPNSLSKMRDHNLAAPEVWRRLSRSYAGTSYESTVRRRYGVECHGGAYEYARRGLMRDAWRLHAESLMTPGGLAFLWFSAWLLLAPFRRLSGQHRGAPYAE
jgi:glycosyltransferase involved in cell wall biosynthesis